MVLLIIESVHSIAVIDAEISDENLVKIVFLEATDQQCNDLAWKCLGYKYQKTRNS